MAAFFCFVFFLNISLTTQQCADYRCRTVSIPLYLKVLDFFDRHYNYKQLTKTIAKDVKDKETRAIKILEWTQANIKRNPRDLPVIDDHVWHIIIRGYGVDDQFQDVFSALCNYSGMEALFITLNAKDSAVKKPLSFVKLKNGWSIFDAYNGVYFQNKTGKIASIKDIISGDWQALSICAEQIQDYGIYFQNLSSLDIEKNKLTRSSIQSPFKRFLFWRIHNK